MIFGENYGQLAASGEYEVYKSGTTIAQLDAAIAGLSDEEYLDSFLTISDNSAIPSENPILRPYSTINRQYILTQVQRSTTDEVSVVTYTATGNIFERTKTLSNGTLNRSTKSLTDGTLTLNSWTLYRRQKSYDVAISGSKAASAIAPVQDSLATANRNYAVGDQFYYDGHLYKVTAIIASGAQIVLGTNAVLTDDVTTQMKPKVLKTSTSSSSVTVGDKLLELKSTYQSLTDDEKQKAFLIYNNIYKFNVTQINGQFSCAYVDSSNGIRTVIADIINGKYVQTRVSTNSNLEYIDTSSTPAGLAISLCIMG